jgi:signal recognition particle subunit SRP54
VDLHDFRRLIIAVKEMGSTRHLMGRIPGSDRTPIDSGRVDTDGEMNHILGMLDSMTLQERSYPVLLTVPQRCLRIAAGAGVEPTDVTNLFRQFKAVRDAMARFERGVWWSA